MIISYLRSSSYSCWDICEHKYYLEYSLGFQGKTNKAAEIGTLVHKALELLARQSLARKNKQGSSIIHDDETGHDITIETSPLELLNLSYNYASVNSNNKWSEADRTRAWGLMQSAMTLNDGMFNPTNLNIIEAEKYFNIVIDKPWAAYSYKIEDGKEIKGQLALKGTLDLIVQRSHNIELIDWKTGQRKNWVTNTEKTYDDLYEDPQLRLYHYAACKLYPDEKEVFVTIFFISAGGPFTLCFQRSQLEETEEMIRRRFETIKNTTRPKLIYPNKKCTILCSFGNTDMQGRPCDYNDSVCNQIKKAIITLGIDKVTDKHMKADALVKYSGGGRSNGASNE